MKLHWSPRSPFVRKVMICAIELEVEDRIERVRTVALMKKSNPELMKDNPLSKIPALLTDDGVALVDSFVICEYLQLIAGGEKIISSDPARRISVLNDHALTTNWMDMLILWRNERNKPKTLESPELLTAFSERTECTLNFLEKTTEVFDTNDFNLGKVSLGVSLAYLNFRFADLDWKMNRPKLTRWFEEFEQRPSVQQTEIDPDG